MGGTPEEFGKIIVSETAKWKKVVEFAGASVEYANAWTGTFQAAGANPGRFDSYSP